jgi:hypothetical protein
MRWLFAALLVVMFLSTGTDLLVNAPLELKVLGATNIGFGVLVAVAFYGDWRADRAARLLDRLLDKRPDVGTGTGEDDGLDPLR